MNTAPSSSLLLNFIRDRVIRPDHSGSDSETSQSADEQYNIDNQNESTPFNDESFLVLNLQDVATKVKCWRALLPRVTPYYAVKCNPDVNILKKLVELGLNFDCASLGEIKALLELGVPCDRLIYANPVKQVSFLKEATRLGIRMMTFDNGDELKKIKINAPEAIVLLRLATDDSRAVCALSNKFGASFESVLPLLKRVQALNINFAGFCYHVGSGCEDANSFVEAVKSARKAFDLARSIGLKPYMLDIGGGFPGEELIYHGKNRTPMVSLAKIPKTGVPEKSFLKITALLNEALDNYFPESEGIKIIAEPGRYLVQSAGTLVSAVIARRKPGKQLAEEVVDAQMKTAIHKAKDADHFRYYISDGVYGAFNNTIYDHATVVPRILTMSDSIEIEEPLKFYDSSLWGPTCDGIDCVVKHTLLPKMKVGDWFYFENMGAYTTCAASRFNGFNKSAIIVFDE